MPGHLPVTVMCVELRHWRRKMIQNMMPLKKNTPCKKTTPLKKTINPNFKNQCGEFSENVVEIKKKNVNEQNFALK